MQTIQRGIVALQRHLLTTDEAPIFWLPPREMHFVAPLDQVVAHVARNESARAAVRAMLAADQELTVTMLDVALQFCEVSFERKPLEVLLPGHRTKVLRHGRS